ncbi:hypothetical protein H6F92_04100 [Microcystis wesenbergii FACHB-1317]|uniref:hypothetical protein n=1 Tax=Microcystis TaxID=1125 RepID=UPI00168099B8|nr:MULTISPECIES: hypothetical protein [Microcystis]MBD2288039.1 hypothetical protein [Microcystis wesenbergii FACHB-1317]UZO75419.1 hypothetical protein M8120_21845 [Microcystis aeruginosa str. Chao 1910]
MANPIKRLNYFNGQFLRAPDFTEEQTYHLEMRRRHNENLHTWGIADGLKLQYTIGSSQIEIAEGMAIDSKGREIVLVEKADKDLSGFVNKTVYVTIAHEYKQVDKTNETGVEGFTRVQEIPTIKISENPPSADQLSLQLILGRVTVNNEGKITATDEGEGVNRRRAAGVVAGDLEARSLTLTDTNVDPSQWSRMRLGAAGRADLQSNLRVTGNLEVTGNIGIATTAAPTQRLEVNGNVKATSFLGDGSNLTGVVKNLDLAVKKAGDTMTGSLTIQNGDLKVTGTITGTIDATNITTGTLNVARIPNLSANKIIDVYDIYLRGSAFDSTEGNITFLKIANFDFGLTTQRGLNTIILNPGGAYKLKANHDVYGDNKNWNKWADWVNSNAAAGDLVAVASYDALSMAPMGGSAATLLGAINGTKAFEAIERVSYALFFIKGESKCIEVLQAHRGPNAHLKTGYAFSQLSFNFNNFNSEEAWIVPAFMNGWINFDTTHNPAGYFKDSLGIVHLRGLVKNGTNNTTIFTLPVGYRPSNQELQAVQTNLNTIGRVDILADGQVTVVSGSNGWVSLDGITFRAGG